MVIIPSDFESKIVTTEHYKSGMGKINATSAAYSLICRGYDTITLSGFCGAIRGYKIGDIVRPTVFIEGDYDTRPLENYPNTIGRGNVLMVSQDRFLTVNPYQFKHAKIACDMESYAIASVCKSFGVKFECLKIVSDIVGVNSASDFLENCKRLGPKLNKLVRSLQ